MQFIITIYVIQNMMILKLGMRFAIRQCFGELSEIVSPALRERIDKSIVGKLNKSKVNFGLGHPIKKKFNLLMSLQSNFINQSLESIFKR